MKSYFAAPNTDCRPDGPLALGSILADPFDPEESLNRKPLLIPDDEIQTTTVTGFEEKLHHKKTRGGGLWLRFVELMSFETRGSRDKGSERTIKADTLTTRAFRPTADYVERSLAVPEVQRYLLAAAANDDGRHIIRRKAVAGRPLYMVTGVKIAEGAAIEATTSSRGSGTLSMSIDGSAVAGVPLGVGADAHSATEAVQAVQFVQATPFVFAYRLRQIRYRKGRLVDQPYRDGALYGVGGGGGVVDNPGVKEQIVFLDLDEDDVAADDVGGTSLETTGSVDGEGADDSDDDDVELVVPSEQ